MIDKKFSLKNQTSRLIIGLCMIAFICILEAWIYRNEDWLKTLYQMETTLHSVGYPAGYQANNNIDNDNIQFESWGLAQNAFTMAGPYQSDKDLSKLDVSYYYPDNYRLLLPFLGSFLLPFFTLRQSFIIVTTFYWIITCYAMYYLGWRVFSSHKVGLAAALLCATSYLYIILVTELRGALFQLSSYLIITALAFFLNHFTNEQYNHALFNSFLLGNICGIFFFGSIGSAYFFPFLFFYGIFSMSPSSFIKKNMSFLLGMGIIIFFINYFAFQSLSSSSYSVLYSNIMGFNFHRWFDAFSTRITQHGIHQTPIILWVGALIGLFFLEKSQMKVILCMFSTFLFSEAVAFAGYTPYVKIMGSYHYMQYIFPIYLLNANLFVRTWNTLSNKPVIIFIKRAAVVIALSIILLTSNLPLFGNYYYYYQLGRPTNPELAYRSFFVFNNQYVYRQLFSHPPQP